MKTIKHRRQQEEDSELMQALLNVMRVIDDERMQGTRPMRIVFPGDRSRREWLEHFVAKANAVGLCFERYATPTDTERA